MATVDRMTALSSHVSKWVSKCISMAQNSNSQDAPWLTNIQTQLFSVYAGNARSSWLVVGAVANCSRHAGLPHWNFGHRNGCASVERSMYWRRLNVADGDQWPSQAGCPQLGMPVSDPPATSAPDMQPCTGSCCLLANRRQRCRRWRPSFRRRRWPDPVCWPSGPDTASSRRRSQAFRRRTTDTRLTDRVGPLSQPTFKKTCAANRKTWLKTATEEQGGAYISSGGFRGGWRRHSRSY